MSILCKYVSTKDRDIKKHVKSKHHSECSFIKETVRNKKYVSPKGMKSPGFKPKTIPLPLLPANDTQPPKPSTEEYRHLQHAFDEAKKKKQEADAEEDRCRKALNAANAGYWQQKATMYQRLWKEEVEKRKNVECQLNRLLKF